jgi:hypothetical protein
MSSPKKELIAGGIVVAILAWVLIDLVATVVRNEQYLPPADPSAISAVIGLAATLYAIGFVVIGAWGIIKASGQLEQWSRRLTFKATIPGYFLMALMPIAAGLILIVITRQTVWGFWLSCFSLPSVLILLALALRKNSKA